MIHPRYRRVAQLTSTYIRPTSHVMRSIAPCIVGLALVVNLGVGAACPTTHLAWSLLFCGFPAGNFLLGAVWPVITLHGYWLTLAVIQETH